MDEPRIIVGKDDPTDPIVTLTIPSTVDRTMDAEATLSLGSVTGTFLIDVENALRPRSKVPGKVRVTITWEPDEPGDPGPPQTERTDRRPRS